MNYQARDIVSMHNSFKRVKDVNGDTTGVYFLDTIHRSYNRTSYRIALVSGKHASPEQIHRYFGGDPYCGGFEPRKYYTYDLGQFFNLEILGCD